MLDLDFVWKQSNFLQLHRFPGPKAPRRDQILAGSVFSAWRVDVVLFQCQLVIDSKFNLEVFFFLGRARRSRGGLMESHLRRCCLG